MQSVDRVRRFNRFYTRRIGALRAGLLDSPFTLPEARVLYEVWAREAPTATRIGAELGIDRGYLSRLVQGLERRGMLAQRRAKDDARNKVLALTARGRRAFAQLERRTREDVAGMLAPLGAAERARLVAAMGTVESLLGSEPAKGAVALRAHRPGDMGWVVHRHGVLYAQEFGWDERFEALVAGIVRDFVQDFDAARERCWIAERDGEPLGSVFVVSQGRATAKLRLLLVEPAARGEGLGRRLVEECIRFATAKGYRRLVLWTQSNLTAARSIYGKCGFRLLKTEKHSDFGVPLDGEYWELNLKGRELRLPRRHGT